MKTQKTIRNCPPGFRYICPKTWAELQQSTDPNVRFCDKCQHAVYFCETDQQTIEHSRAGHCIARLAPDASEMPQREMYLGLPEKVLEEPKFTPAQLEAEDWHIREQLIDDAIKDAPHANRNCPECGFPMPGWRKTCHVCKTEIGRAMN